MQQRPQFFCTPGLSSTVFDCGAHLQGRATLKMKVSMKETPQGPRDVVMTIVADGYNAPVSAGSFVDLVERGFYSALFNKFLYEDRFVFAADRQDD